MSGIAGIYYRDGRPCDRGLLTRMTDVMEERGPHGAGQWAGESVGLGHRMLATTPESRDESQPLLDESGSLCLVLDGRVDNRAELRAALESHGVVLRNETDAEYVLKAYECWGESSVERIIGDFALAIWDRRRRRLFCARDPLGIRPFYYYIGDRVFVFGSELRQILLSADVARKPNEGMIAEYLAGAMNSSEETLYLGVLRLPPAHYLTVEAGKVQTRRYFDIDPRKEIRYRDDREYAGHFLEILTEAVSCRLRSPAPVGIALSGGLDSSSVAAIAKNLPGLGSEAFSMVFPGRSCDESSYIAQVLEKTGITGYRCLPSDMPASYYRDQARRYGDFPDYPNGAMAHALTRAARDKGFRVLLTGLGGDEWLMGSFYRYADLLRSFRFVEFLRKVRDNAQLSGPRFSWATVLRFGLWPLVPNRVQKSLEGALQRNRTPDWIDPAFARRAGLAGRLRQRPAAPVMRTFAQQDLHDVLNSGWRIHALEMENRAASSAGIEHRHPFSDRRILEFALALPEEQRWRSDQTKFILRESMRSLLPEPVRLRQTKAEFSPVFTSAFENGGGERLFDSLAISSPGWVDAERVRAKYREMVALQQGGDPAYTQHTCPLWMIYGINVWYETVFESSSSPALMDAAAREPEIAIAN